MAIEIVEVLDRADQGATRPFICRGEDNHVYFVKGKGAGRRSQICELVAGHLAQALHLPVAPFEIVTVSDALISAGFRDDLADLGVGPAFGSLRRQVTELTVSRIAEVPTRTRRDVLAFDWWVRNGDRTLTSLGGNPNLFWNIDTQELLVLDHNQAFDPTFSSEEFFSNHAFADSARTLFGDWLARDEYEKRFEQALRGWNAITDLVPREWLYFDDEQTVPTDLDLTRTREQLELYRSKEFWSML